MRQLTEAERYELVRSRAGFFNEAEFSLDRVELLKASYRSGFISGIDWQKAHTQAWLDAIQAMLTRWKQFANEPMASPRARYITKECIEDLEAIMTRITLK